MHKMTRISLTVPEDYKPRGDIVRNIIEGDLVMDHSYKKKTKAEKLLLKIAKHK
jgi:hypothetical protein